MSTDPRPRLPLAKARALANQIVDVIRPVCDRIEIAGSIRRKKVDCGDIEVCCVPKARYNLFGEAFYQSGSIEDILFLAGYHFTKNGEHMKQFDLGVCMVDLFITTPAQWGAILVIRTGPQEFSQRLVTSKAHGGYMPSYLQEKDGRIVHRETGKMLDTPEEEDYFRVIGLDYIPPEKRK